MKKIIISLAFCLFSINSYAFDIYALGTSVTNCKNAGQAYTNRLNELLSSKGIRVINGGSDGDWPRYMRPRLESQVDTNKELKLVIFEPGPNQKHIPSNIEDSGNILDYLKIRGIKTIYVSNGWIQDDQEAKEFSQKYGAFYYGPRTKVVPVNRDNYQYDTRNGSPGHMTVQGCQLWADDMAKFILQVAQENNIH